MIFIERTDPRTVKHFLQQAIDRTPGNENTLDELLEADHAVFAIREDNELLGGCLLMRFGTVLNPVLLAGNNIKHWKQAFQDWLVELAKDLGCDSIQFVSRLGMGKAFPEYKIIGAVYELKL